MIQELMNKIPIGSEFVGYIDECQIHNTNDLVQAIVFYNTKSKQFVAKTISNENIITLYKYQCDDDFDPKNPTDEQRWSIINYMLGSTTDVELSSYALMDAWMSNMYMKEI